MKAVLAHENLLQIADIDLTCVYPHGFAPRRVDFIVYCQHCGDKWAMVTCQPPVGPSVDVPPNQQTGAGYAAHPCYESLAHLCQTCGSGSLLALNEALEFTDFQIPDSFLAHELTLWANRGDSYWVLGTYYI